MAHTLGAKFRNAEELKFVELAATYVRMTPKQFIRIAALKEAQSIREEVMKRAEAVSTAGEESNES